MQMLPIIRFTFDESAQSVHNVFQTTINTFYNLSNFPENERPHLERILYNWVAIMIDRHTSYEAPLQKGQWVEYYSTYKFSTYDIKAMVIIKGV